MQQNLGLERIKTLASKVEDPALLKVITYLLSREDMNEKYLNEEKTLTQMVTFIQGEARKNSKNGIAFVDDEVVYGWAIHYFDESNKDLGLNKQVNIKKTNDEIQEESKNTKIKNNKSKNNFKKWVAEGQLSLFDL